MKVLNLGSEMVATIRLASQGLFASIIPAESARLRAEATPASYLVDLQPLSVALFALADRIALTARDPLAQNHPRVCDRARSDLGATQWRASRLGFQPQLGVSLVRTPGRASLCPAAWLLLGWYHDDTYAAPIFAEGAAIAASRGCAALGMSVLRALG
jgi:hypothetical protein